MGSNIGLAILIISILSILLGAYSCKRLENTKFLKGFWTADQTYCQKADLSAFVLRLGDNGSGYFLIVNDEGVILNTPARIKLKNKTLNCWANCQQCDVAITWPAEKPDCFPSRQKLYYYPSFGKMVFVAKGSAGDEVKAVLYRDFASEEVWN